MCENQRALLSKVKIEDNGTVHTYYSFSPTRAKFWMGFVIAIITLAGMLLAIRAGAENAVETFVKSRCAAYLAQFHEEVRPRLDGDRASDIDEAIANHTMETSAEYAANSHTIQMEQALAISDIRSDISAIKATQAGWVIAEEAQTRMLQELMRRGE